MSSKTPFYRKLRDELREFTRDRTEIQRVRNALCHGWNDSPGDAEALLPETKLRNWRTAGRLPDVAIEGAAMGMRLCLRHLGDPTAVEPPGYSTTESAPTDAKESPSQAQSAVPDDLVVQHKDALDTTWMWGERAWHFMRMDEGAPGDICGARIWRFWEGIRMVPKSYEPRVEVEDTWLVHSSKLDGDDRLIANQQAFGIEPGSGGAFLPEEEDERDRVDFLARIGHDDPPSTYGYCYDVVKRFRTQATKNLRFESFSGANAAVVRTGTIVVSLPKSLFRFLDAAEGISFASVMPMLPRAYIQRIAEKAKRGALGERHGLYATWARPAEAQHRVDLLTDLWRVCGLGPMEKPHSLIQATAGDLFSRERVVFAAIYRMPSPLAYQTLMWRLPDPA